MPSVRRRKSERQSMVSLVGIPTIPESLHHAFGIGNDPEGADLGEIGELGLDHIGVATAEIRRRQLARLTGNPDFQLPDETRRWE